MNYSSSKNLFVSVLLIISPLFVNAEMPDLKIDLKMTNPIDCRYSTSWWVTSASDLRSHQTEEDLLIEIDFSYGECAREKFIPGAINSNWPPERMITIMKEGFKFPWNYKAKIKIDATITKQDDGSEIVTAKLAIPKKDIFQNNSNLKRYEVSFKPDRSDNAYFVWYLDIAKDNSNSRAISIKMSQK